MSRLWKIILITSIMTVNAHAARVIKFFNPAQVTADVPFNKINEMIKKHFAIDQYREVKVQIIKNAQQQPDHLLVYLFSKKYHRVEIARININPHFDNTMIFNNYKLTNEDLAAQPGAPYDIDKCPDPSIEFIAFCPNDDELELNITKEVANYAKAHHLKTVQLLLGKATSQNYMKYMHCPKLKGNFYDGDATQEYITTYDGIISSSKINTRLNHQFAYKVTNIWLACEAYNDPMKSSLLDSAQSQKYAAGINDLLIGPSDQAAACAMEAAIDGNPMTDSFNACYIKYDIPEDLWGFGGDGSDVFGS